jgi:dTMP kinase
MQEKKKGVFISFEGIDGCGKTTQVNNLMDFLRKNDLPFVKTREPGGTVLGEILRRVLKYPEETYDVLKNYHINNLDFMLIDGKQARTKPAEILLFQAARAELINYVIEPNLKSGINVIADRFADSTRAYQGGGNYKGDMKAINFINTVHDYILQSNWPDKTFLLRIPYHISRQRLEHIGSGKDEFEKRKKEFTIGVINEYDNIAKDYPNRVVVIDGTKAKEEVFEQILEYVRPLFGLENK